MLEVVWLLYHAGAPDHVIAAGVLHDTVEKTAANAAELRTRFGFALAMLVLAVSEDQRILGDAEPQRCSDGPRLRLSGCLPLGLLERTESPG